MPLRANNRILYPSLSANIFNFQLVILLLQRFFPTEMKVFETKNALAQALGSYRTGHTSIGFVPTMGALHAGHLSLVEQCCKENDVIVVSIFVNPAQFNDKNDLANYPRTMEEDLKMLTPAGCDVVFAPSVEEMYPVEDTRVFDFGILDKVMEGAHRPGHFNGVVQIVSRLFDAVQPDRAYFGEKDFQQLAIIRRMVAMMDYPVQITGCPIMREADGLAMSSRNVRLTSKQRQIVPVIARTLFACKEKISDMPLEELKKWVVEQIDSTDLRTEYFDIVNRDTLQTAAQYNPDALQGCIAVHAGAVRLIDNIRL